MPYHGQNGRDSRDDFHDKVRCQTCYLTYTTTIVQLLQDNDRKTQKKKRSLTRHSGILCQKRMEFMKKVKLLAMYAKCHVFLVWRKIRVFTQAGRRQIFWRQRRCVICVRTPDIDSGHLDCLVSTYRGLLPRCFAKQSNIASSTVKGRS